MIVPGATRVLKNNVRLLATGLSFTSACKVFVQRDSDNYYLKADDTWAAAAPTGANLPVSAWSAGAQAQLFTLSATASASLVLGSAVTHTMSDNETPASATVGSDIVEHEIKAVHDVSTSSVLDMVESQRGDHTTQGPVIYVAPINGNDTTGVGSRLLPYKTVTKALSVTVSGTHTLIYLIADQASAVTVSVESITWNKDYTFLRGPGRDMLLRGASANTPTIAVTARGAEFSGFQLESHASGANAHGISATGADFLLARGIWINATQGTGVHLTNCSNSKVYRCQFQNTGAGASGHGIIILNSGVGDSRYNEVCECSFADVQGDAIRLSSGGAGVHDNTTICKNNITDSTGWGINIQGAGVIHAVVHDNTMGNNASGSINDLGTDTTAMNNEQWSTFVGSAATIADAVLDELINDHLSAGSFGEAVAIARGLMQHNYLLDNPTYDADGLLLSARIRVFQSKADTDSGTNPIVTLTVAGSVSGGLGQSLKVTRNP